jgi:hypothetical protein
VTADTSGSVTDVTIQPVIDDTHDPVTGVTDGRTWMGDDAPVKCDHGGR